MSGARFPSTILASLALLLGLFLAAAQADRRVALVIGNADYRSEARLRNPRNDADDVAAAFERLGFAVEKHHDLTFAGMRRALRSFARDSAGADMAVVLFAGHGMEVGGRNYLIPTDAELATDRDLSYEAFEIEKVTEAVADAKGLKLVILDACRNNPFAQSMELTSSSRAIGRGFKRVEPATGGMLIAYSAAAGTTADDGNGRNSPYTQALLEHIEEPGVDIRILFGKVRDSILQHSGGQQRPAEYGSLPGNAIFLSAPRVSAPSTETDTSAPNASSATVAVAWDIVEKSDEVGLLEAFRSQFGEANPFYDTLAMQRIEAIAKRASCDRLAADKHDRKARGAGKDFDELRDHASEAIEACSLASKAFPDDLTTRYQLGLSYRVNFEDSEALEELRIAAAGGYAAAQVVLGEYFEMGFAVSRDLSEAAKLYREAAEQGNVVGQLKLGLIYANGAGVEHNDAEALKWIRRAAVQGYSNGQVVLGSLYSDGRSGVVQDHAEAVKWYRKAAEQGDKDGQISLGLMYEQGFGVPKDIDKAEALYRLAASQGDAAAKMLLRRLGRP